jgi:hypothetical protein
MENFKRLVDAGANNPHKPGPGEPGRLGMKGAGKMNFEFKFAGKDYKVLTEPDLCNSARSVSGVAFCAKAQGPEGGIHSVEWEVPDPQAEVENDFSGVCDWENPIWVDN